MSLSIENRQRIALLAFFAGDHLLWYYGGHFQQVSLFYVVLSEIVRMGALFALAASFSFPAFLQKYLFITAIYCQVMIPLNYWGDSVNSKFGLPLINLLWFKKDSSIPVDYAFLAFVLYAVFLAYLFKLKFK